MKKFLLAAFTSALLAGTASATTYSVDVTANPYRAPGQPGLQTRAVVLSPSGAQNFNGSTISFALNNNGDSFSTDIFGLVHYDAPVNADDLIPRPSTATFDFGLGSATLQGTTVALGSIGGPGPALATYLYGRVIISATQQIRITLTDTIFGSNNGTFVNGRPGVGIVNATFTLAAVPVPATLPLIVSALGMMGFVARRRKAAAKV